jgi:hypothetical protein
MKYAKYIPAVVIVVSFYAWQNLGAEVSSTPKESNPVALAEQATGLTFASKVETIPGGQIDWTRGTVCAVGVGKSRPDATGRQAELLAKRAAYIVAARNTALVLAGIRVGPGGRFENVRDGWIRADVVLTGFRELGATYDPNTRTATARMEIPLCGVRGAVNVLGLTGRKPHRSHWQWPNVSGKEKPYDVIVIDVRELSCKPGVLPQIVTAANQNIFDAADILADGILKRPAVRYVTIRRETTIPCRAEKNRRRCLTIKADHIDANGAIVLDQANLNLLTRAPGTQQTLRRGNLVIVTDE